MIIVGAYQPNFIRYTNPKFSEQNSVNFKWIEQGEEFGKIVCGGGSVIVLCNRKINFTDDINYYSKLIPNAAKKPIDCLRRMRDTVGTLD